MNHKLFGKNYMMKNLFMAVLVLALSACTESIPGDPQKVTKDYVNALQQNDFSAIYKMNYLTVRQKRLLVREEDEAGQKLMEEYFNKHKADYDSVDAGFTDRGTWHEKFYFPKTAKLKFGKASYPKAAPDDPVNADYEKAQNVYVKIKTTYNAPDEAPIYGERKIKEIYFDCFLKKIRKEGNVRIYSHDEQWFVADIVPDLSTVVYF